jgi:hypothetical protein
LRIELARVLAQEKRLDEAAALYREARERISELLGPDEFTAVAAGSALADVYMEQGRFAQARAESTVPTRRCCGRWAPSTRARASRPSTWHWSSCSPARLPTP